MTQRSLSRLRASAAALVSFALFLTGVTSCFSERSTPTETVSVTDCTTPSNVAGATLVFIRDFVYVPVNLHVKAGASVAWVNCEPTNIPHTSTSDGAGWESGSLAPNDAYVRSFPTAGTYPYHCAIHPGMKATVIVE
jgi:plastocyanin